MSRARQRWLPALLIPLALALAALVGTVQAGATVSLPPKSAEEILAMIARTEVRALSGTVQQTAELGLPEAPSPGPGITPGSGTALEFLTGSHTARVYVDAPSKARLQILDRMAERDFIVNGSDAWFYNSADNSATHVTLPRPTMEDLEAAPSKPVRPELPTPESMAARFLEAIDSSTEVTVGAASMVAGRTAYRLHLDPRSTETLVDSVSIDVDSETGLPLGVEIRANGQAEPAYSLAYSELSLAAPDAELFDFTPPPGAGVTEKTLPAKPLPPTMPLPEPDAPASPMFSHGPSVTGKAWDAIIALPAGSAPPELTSNPQLAQAFQPANGGRAMTTSLLSILILDDGRVYAGMVPLDRLESAAAAG